MLEQYFKLPEECFVNTRVPKKAFINSPEFNLKKKEKDVLKNCVENIYFKYTFKPEVLNIPSYENEDIRYEEIEVIKVKINKRNKEDKVCNIIQKYIQYPMVIVIEYEESIKFNIALKKINKVEKEKLVIEKMIYTDWINLTNLDQKETDFFRNLDISKFSTNNLYNLYQGFFNIINSFNLSKYREEFKAKSIEETTKDIEFLDEIERLEDEVITLRNKLKKESNIGVKVDINVKIKKIQDKIEKTKDILK